MNLPQTLDSPGSSVFDLPIQPAPVFRPLATPSRQYPSISAPSFIVLSGGTGGNAICSAFGLNATYVLPVSDDGGSSSEIIRVLGGPSVGDIRSRLVRLIPPAPPSSPLSAICKLLAYRLPARCGQREARDEWRDIVEGRSFLWKGISNDRKETIRGFLVYFESELLKRAHKNFDFRNGSIGNYFLAAAQGFFRSLPAAIFLFSSITNSQANILPVIVTNHTVTIAAELVTPILIQLLLILKYKSSKGKRRENAPINITVSDERGELPLLDGLSQLPAQHQNVMYEPENDGAYDRLRSRIFRVYYINSYGMEIHPSPNPDYISNLASRDFLVYSCGSLWTSIIPCLALRGVARAIASSPSLRAKVLLLNSENDRETDGYDAADYIHAIVRTLNSNYHIKPYGLGNANTTYPVSAFVTDLVYLKGTKVSVDLPRITSLGVRCTEVEVVTVGGRSQFAVDNVSDVLAKIWEERKL